MHHNVLQAGAPPHTAGLDSYQFFSTLIFRIISVNFAAEEKHLNPIRSAFLNVIRPTILKDYCYTVKIVGCE